MIDGMKPGRPSKGERVTYPLRTPPEHMETYRAAAAEAGLKLSDYLAAVLAQSHDLDPPAYVGQPTKADQPELLTG